MKLKILYVTLSILLLQQSLCAQESGFPYRCGFNNGLDGWENISHLPAEWTIGQGNAAHRELASGFVTGPESAYEGGGYAYVNLMDHPVDGKDISIVKTFDFSQLTNPIFSMRAHSHWTLGDGASLILSAKESSAQIYRDLVTQYEQKGEEWYIFNTCLSNYAGLKSVDIKITVRNNGTQSPNIAIDDLLIEDFRVKAEATNASCYKAQDGTVTVSPIGAGPIYKYSINHEVTYTQSTQTVYKETGLKAGTYPVYIMDVLSGCKAYDHSIQVVQPPKIDVETIVSELTCYGDNSGKIEVRASETDMGGDVSHRPYQYSIDGGISYKSYNVFSGLTGGNYNVLVKNSNGCVSEPDIVSLGENVLLEIASVTTTDIERCHGDATGTIYISANFNTNGPLDYSVDGGATFHNGNNNFSKLPAGEYDIVVKDRNNCKVWLDSTVTIYEPELLMIDDIEVSDVDGCHGDQNGGIQIHLSGGQSPYRYSVNNGISFETSNRFGGLAAGTYRIHTIDSAGCRTDVQEITISEPDPLEIYNVEIDNVEDCYGDASGHIGIWARGGTGQLRYEINAKLNQLQTSREFYGLTAGTYLPYVVDEKNCQAIHGIVTITEPEKFSIASASKFDGDIRCHGEQKGLIYALANGGTLPYIYSIDNYAHSITTPKLESCTFSDLGAGSYTLKAKDSRGCTATDTILVIEEPDLLKITNVTIADVNCYGEKSGSATLTATGGVGGYSYGVSRNQERTFKYQISNIIKDLGAETYDFAVKDAHGCLAYSYEKTITQPEELEFLTINTYPVKGCHGDSTGSIILAGKGGVEPYRYSIDGGKTYQGDVMFAALPGGNNYVPAITDSHGCVVTGTREVIQQPSEIRISNINYHEVKGCNGSNAGSLSFEAEGGTGQLTYMANSISNRTGKFSNLYAGTYNLVVYDERGCNIKHPGIKITEPDELVIDSTKIVHEKCFGDINGSYTIHASGGRAYQTNFPYKFFLNDSQNPSNYDGQFMQLPAGNYRYRMEDKYGCAVSGKFTIKEPEEFKIPSLDTVNINTCRGHKTGYIKVHTQGGIEPFSYTANGIGYSAENTTGIFTDLGANQYELIATDANGCHAEAYTSLVEPSQVQFSASLTREIDCYNEGLAEIEVKASGGVGYYAVSIDGGENFAYGEGLISGLHSGSYTVKVRDANECEAKYTKVITVINPPELTVEGTSENVICHEGNTGKILAFASGGTKPYYYSLDKKNWQTSSGAFSNLTDSTYTVYVRDYNGCTSQTGEFVITRPENQAGFSTSVSEGCSPLEVTITQEKNGVTNYFISNGDNIYDRKGPTRYTITNETNAVKKYTITATMIPENGIGCTDTASATITVYPQPKVDFMTDYEKITWPNNTVSLMNLSQNIMEAHWDFGDGATSSNILEESHTYSNCGNYLIRLIASDGRCSDTSEHSFLIEGRSIMASFATDKITGCEPVTVEFTNTSINSDSCMWDFGDGTSPVYNADRIKHTYAAPGQYRAVLTLYGDCGSQTSTTKTIQVFNKPTAAFSQNLDTLYEGQQLMLSCESSVNDHYYWTFGDGKSSTEREPVHEYEKNGIYNVELIVTTEHSCSDTAKVKNAVVVITKPIVIFPNAFSPNSDGINDRFLPIHGDVKSYEIVIHNRYGSIMYNSTDISEGWDGTRGGIHCPPGIYVYKAKVVMRDNKFFHLQGKIMLLR